MLNGYPPEYAGVKDNPGLVDVVNELLSFYLEKHPSAENLIKLFYNSK